MELKTAIRMIIFDFTLRLEIDSIPLERTCICHVVETVSKLMKEMKETLGTNSFESLLKELNDQKREQKGDTEVWIVHGKLRGCYSLKHFLHVLLDFADKLN